jgi:hypothetical protein
MIVWGGCGDSLCSTNLNLFTGGPVRSCGGCVDPDEHGSVHALRCSNHVAVWTGAQMMIWGGWKGSTAWLTNTGALYCAGAAPSGSPGESEGLLLGKNANGSDLDLTWNPSCMATTDYAVYAGIMGSWYSHAIELCSTGGSTATTITPTAGSDYYLVVPLTPAAEGSYGQDSAGSERPPAAVACVATQIVAPCP